MAVIATMNRKGGCGKSTLAAHLAVWLAQQGQRIMLADVDFQQSTRRWLQRRRAGAASVEFAHVVTDARYLQRPPAGVNHAVMDTPGGIHGFELARLLMFSDVVMMPVCDSAFDYEASADCIAEMRLHPKVAKGKVQVAAMGLRIEPGSAADGRARAWAARHDVRYLGSVRYSPLYEKGAAAGLTVFDDSSRSPGSPERADWNPVLQWLEDVLAPGTGETVARKWRSLPEGSNDSQFGESTFGLSNFGPVERITEPMSFATRSPGSGRSEPAPGLMRRVLDGLPRWSSQGRISPFE